MHNKIDMAHSRNLEDATFLDVRRKMWNVTLGLFVDNKKLHRKGDTDTATTEIKDIASQDVQSCTSLLLAAGGQN